MPKTAEDADLKKLGADLRAGLQQMIDNILKAERWGAVDESNCPSPGGFWEDHPKIVVSNFSTARHSYKRTMRPKN